jgi:flagellar FliJ protein
MNRPLAVLIELAQRRCDDAARALAGRAAACEDARQRGTLLERYRGEYTAQLDKTARAGIDGAALRNMHHFLVRVDEAHAQQQRDVETCARRFEEARAAWQAARRKFEAFAALDRRREAAEALGARRAEQRGQDEAAARRFRARAKNENQELR